jgi:DNA-binding NarL/FixJ family response regulator
MSADTSKSKPSRQTVPTSAKPISVSIVEDDDWLRKDLAREISAAPGFCCLSIFATAEEALRKLPVESPDVVIMDINLPGLNGIECVRRLKEISPEMCILMLTVYEESDLIFDALRAGASGYLLKRIDSGELLEAIADAHQGGSPMASSVARQVVKFFARPPASEVEVDGLTTREEEILNLLVKGHAYKSVADQLSISINTVRMFIRRIYKKMHVHSRSEATAKVQSGLPKIHLFK